MLSMTLKEQKQFAASAVLFWAICSWTLDWTLCLYPESGLLAAEKPDD
jgi:hypothetical protein